VINGSSLTPSFPTQCDIVGDEGLKEYQQTGSGAIRCRARVELGKQSRARGKDRPTLTFTCLPPGCNPEKLGEQIKSELEKGRLDNIAEVIDESDRTGDRVTVVAKPGADVALIQRQLYAYTDLDTKYSAKTLVIDNLKPIELSPNQLIARWKAWRLDVLERKFTHERNLKESRLEIVTGLIKAIGKIDTVIKVIRAAKSQKEALIELVSNRTLKFTADQARAILEMRLRQLTNLDVAELESEKSDLESRLQDLAKLIDDKNARTKYMVTEIKKIGVRYGESGRSLIIDQPDTLRVEKGSPKATPVAKPRFLKIDSKKGTIEQVKGPRGAIVLEKTDKLVAITQDGTLKKLPATFKGPIADGYSPVVLAKKESDVATRKYLLVFTLDDQLKALTIDGSDLCKVTSKGKSILPEGAVLAHFGEGSYTVPWSSTRKKKVELSAANTKLGKPGAKGVKIANSNEITLP
jgi:DNA gyrase subunit A